MSEMNSTLIRLKMDRGEKVSDLDGKAIEAIQNERHRVQEFAEQQQARASQQPDGCVHSAEEGRETDQDGGRTGIIFKEVKAARFLNVMETTNLQIQEVKNTQTRAHKTHTRKKKHSP